jgi:hypothetical protein
MLKESDTRLLEYIKTKGYDYVMENYELSDEFIIMTDTMLSIVNWCGLALYQKLSEDIIRRYKDKLCWHFVMNKQNHIPFEVLDSIRPEKYK